MQSRLALALALAAVSPSLGRRRNVVPTPEKSVASGLRTRVSSRLLIPAPLAPLPQEGGGMCHQMGHSVKGSSVQK